MKTACLFTCEEESLSVVSGYLREVILDIHNMMYSIKPYTETWSIYNDAESAFTNLKTRIDNEAKNYYAKKKENQ